MSAPRSFLYVPGDRPERLAKSLSRGANAVVADLEDAVAEGAKDEALDNIDAWLETLSASETQIWVRLNGKARREHEVRRLAYHPVLTGFFVPKVESADEVKNVDEWIGSDNPDLALAPMIESATGLVRIHEIAATARTVQLHIGEMDLAADLGVSPGDDEAELLSARSLMVIASRHASLLPPAAPVSAEIDDQQHYRETTQRLKRIGFVGRDCIHPAQVAIVNQEFTPTPAEVSWANEILLIAASSQGAFRAPDGTMVDEAVLRRARQFTS